MGMPLIFSRMFTALMNISYTASIDYNFCVHITFIPLSFSTVLRFPWSPMRKLAELSAKKTHMLEQHCFWLKVVQPRQQRPCNVDLMLLLRCATKCYKFVVNWRSVCAFSLQWSQEILSTPFLFVSIHLFLIFLSWIFVTCYVEGAVLYFIFNYIELLNWTYCRLYCCAIRSRCTASVFIAWGSYRCSYNGRLWPHHARCLPSSFENERQRVCENITSLRWWYYWMI